jgi:hypothetical protein
LGSKFLSLPICLLRIPYWEENEEEEAEEELASGTQRKQWKRKMQPIQTFLKPEKTKLMCIEKEPKFYVPPVSQSSSPGKLIALEQKGSTTNLQRPFFRYLSPSPASGL